MDKIKLCRDEQEDGIDFIDYIVEKVYENYNKREIVLWGKYITSDQIKERLESRYGMDIVFYVDNDISKIDEKQVRSKKCLRGGPKQYYIVIPLRFYQSLKDELNEYGYRKDVDYYYFCDCIVQDTNDYYEDLHGNKIIGEHGNLSVAFVGFGSVIKIGQEVSFRDCSISIKNGSKLEIGTQVSLCGCSIYIGHDSKITIGDKTDIKSSTLDISNGSYFRIGRGGLLHKGTRVRMGEYASLTIGNYFSVAEHSLWTMGSYTECVVGEDCMFSYDINIRVVDGHSIFDVKSGKNINSTQEILKKRRIIIGNHVWIGMCSTILYHTDIGDGSIIGAASLVKSKIPNNCIAAGIPAKVIRRDIAWSRQNMADDIRACGEAYISLTNDNMLKQNIETKNDTYL